MLETEQALPIPLRCIGRGSLHSFKSISKSGSLPNPIEPEPNFGASAESVGALLSSRVRKTDEAGRLSVGEQVWDYVWD